MTGARWLAHDEDDVEVLPAGIALDVAVTGRLFVYNLGDQLYRVIGRESGDPPAVS